MQKKEADSLKLVADKIRQKSSFVADEKQAQFYLIKSIIISIEFVVSHFC